MFSRRSLCAPCCLPPPPCCPAGFASAQEGPHIATVNPAKVFNEMQETKDLKQKMESDRTGHPGRRRSAAPEIWRKRRKGPATCSPRAADEFNKANQEMIEKAVGCRPGRK